MTSQLYVTLALLMTTVDCVIDVDDERRLPPFPALAGQSHHLDVAMVIESFHSSNCLAYIVVAFL